MTDTIKAKQVKEDGEGKWQCGLLLISVVPIQLGTIAISIFSKTFICVCMCSCVYRKHEHAGAPGV